MMLLVIAIVFVALMIIAAVFFNASKSIIVLSWAVGGIGFSLIYFDFLQDIDAVLSIASVTALGFLPLRKEKNESRRVVFGAIPILALLLVTFIIGELPASFSSTGLIYLTAYIATILGVLVNLSAAVAGISKETQRRGAAFLAIFGGVVGILIAGTGRSSLANSQYGVSVRSDEGIVHFVLEGFRGLDSGIKLAVSTPLATLEWLWIVLGVIAIIGVFTNFLPRQFEHLSNKFSWAIGGSLVGISIYLPQLIKGLSLPDAGPYRDYIQQVLLTKELPSQASNGASFNYFEPLFVAFRDLLPEVYTLVFGMLMMGASIFWSSRIKEEGAEESEDRVSRYTLMQRASFGFWLAWFISLILMRTMFGVAGIGSSAEWLMLGGAIFISGLTFLSDMRSPFTSKISALMPGVALALIFVLFAVGIRFGAILGLSITVF